MKHTPPLTLTTCVDERCLCPAEVLDDYVVESTEGDVRHRVVLCLRGHRLYAIGEGDPPRGTVPTSA